MPIISIRDLVVEYDGRRVLNGLNLVIVADAVFTAIFYFTVKP